eukprot:868319-Rhodomonas_salina.1
MPKPCSTIRANQYHLRRSELYVRQYHEPEPTTPVGHARARHALASTTPTTHSHCGHAPVPRGHAECSAPRCASPTTPPSAN